MGDEEQVSRQEFEALKADVSEFKTTIIQRINGVLTEVQSHIDRQEKRQKDILNYLNSDEFLNYKTKLKKHEKVT